MNAQQQTYTKILEGRTSGTWMAELIFTPEGTERSFLKGAIIKMTRAYKEVEFVLSAGKIYESCESSNKKQYRYYWVNGENYSSLASAQAALKPATPTIPTQSEINRSAWLKARIINARMHGLTSLEAARKGSKKYLSQAFREVWADIKAGTFTPAP